MPEKKATLLVVFLWWLWTDKFSPVMVTAESLTNYPWAKPAWLAIRKQNRTFPGSVLLLVEWLWLAKEPNLERSDLVIRRCFRGLPMGRIAPSMKNWIGPKKGLCSPVGSFFEENLPLFLSLSLSIFFLFFFLLKRGNIFLKGIVYPLAEA